MDRARILAAASLVALLFLAGCDWYQPGFDATNDGNNPTETAASPADLAGLHEDWEHVAPGTIAPVLATAHGRVVAASGNTLTALDAATGALDWSVAAPDDRSVADPSDVCTGAAVPTGTFGPVAVGGVVTGLTVDCIYGETSPHWIGTVDLFSGAVTWAEAPFSYGSAGDAEVTVSQTVVGSTRYTTFTAKDRGDTAGYLQGGSTDVGFYPSSRIGRPAFAANRAFVTTDQALLGVDLANAGTPLWSAGLTSTDAPTPSVSGSSVFLTDGTALKAFDQATGALLWTAALPAAGTDDAPAVAGGRVYVRTANQVVAIDAATGTRLWIGSLGTLGTTASGLGSPSLANGIVYVGSQDGKLLAFDGTGARGCSGAPVVCTPIASVGLGGTPDASRPIPADGAVYIGARRAYGTIAVDRFTPT
jgi:outer membrane protein assembly factor BamB